MRQKKREFWKYILFSILGMLGSSCTILADTFFVSNRLGEEGLAALNLVIAVFSLMNGTGMMLGVGGATRYTVLKAGGKGKEADRVFSLGFLAAVFAGLLFWTAGCIGAETIPRLLGADEELIPLCTGYLRTVLSFSPFFILHHFFMAFIRNDGSPKLAMSMMMAGSLANILLDYLFLYPCRMGMPGAALATGLAPVIGLLIGLFHFRDRKRGFHFTAVKIEVSGLVKIMETGSSVFANEVSGGIVLMVFNLLILKCAGNTGVAAYGIVANLALVVLAVFTGITQGLQPLVSRAYGAGDRLEAERLYRKGRRLTFVIGLCVLCVFYAAGETVILLFNSGREPVLQALAEEGMRLYFTGFLFAGCNYLTASFFCIIQKPKAALGLSFFRGFAGITGIAVLFAELFGMKGIWCAFPVVEFCAMAGAWMFRKRQSGTA